MVKPLMFHMKHRLMHLIENQWRHRHSALGLDQERARLALALDPAPPSRACAGAREANFKTARGRPSSAQPASHTPVLSPACPHLT